MRIVVAVHDPPVWTLPVADVQRIGAALPGDDVVDARTPAERRAALPGADVLLATRLSRDEFESTRRLRWIQSSAVGVGGLLGPEVTRSAVVVTNARGLHSEAIAEHAIALVIALRRRLHTAAARQAARDWAQLELMAARAPALADSRMLVVGLGEIGGRVAALAAGLGMRVTGVRRRPDLSPPAGTSEVFGLDRLRDLLPLADVVVLAVPVTDETRTLIGAEELARMRPSAILVNVARGALVDEGALIAALEAGRLGAAGLDAFVREPLPSDHRLWRLPNVLITPHTAAFGGDYWAPVVALFLDNLGRFRRGEPLRNVVDKTQGY